MKLLLTKSAQELSASYAKQNLAAKKGGAGGVCYFARDSGGFGNRAGKGQLVGSEVRRSGTICRARGSLRWVCDFWKGCMEL